MSLARGPGGLLRPSTTHIVLPEVALSLSVGLHHHLRGLGLADGDEARRRGGQRLWETAHVTTLRGGPVRRRGRWNASRSQLDPSGEARAL